MRMGSDHRQRSLVQSITRELAPILILFSGIFLGSIWSIATRSDLMSSPPLNFNENVGSRELAF